MRYIAFIVFFVVSLNLKAQDMVFEERWTYADRDYSLFSLDLTRWGGIIVGRHISIALWGRRIESFGKDEISFNGRLKDNVATIAIRNGYDSSPQNKPGKATIKFLGGDSLKFELIEEPEGFAHYLPSECILYRDLDYQKK